MIAILGMILQQLAPIFIPAIVEAIRRGVDPHTIDWVEWVKHYGRSPEELQAEVNTQQTGEKEV